MDAVGEVDGEVVSYVAGRYEMVIAVTYNTINLSAGDLEKMITDTGFVHVETRHISRTGKPINIPRGNVV